jgi:hypothetical protein
MNSVGGVIGTNHKSPMRPGRRHLLPLKDAKQEVTHNSLRLFHKSIGTGCSHPCGICRFFWPTGKSGRVKVISKLGRMMIPSSEVDRLLAQKETYTGYLVRR